MRTCPRCADDCPSAAIYCFGCGAALLPFADMVRELAAMRERSATARVLGAVAPRPPKKTCVYCGRRTRHASGVCASCSDLPALHGAAGKSRLG